MHECCQDEANRIKLPTDQNPDRPDIVVERCGTCARRHITLEVEAGHYNLRMA
jgi:hypothetical protein